MAMPLFRHALLLLGVLLWLSVLGGCSGQAQRPDLLGVVDVSPRELEVGDRLELIGSGFPEGKVATVTLAGTLHQGGAEVRDVNVVLRASATSRNHVVVRVTSELIRELCGPGKEARHTTFRGKLVAAFAPRSSGAPPITGSLPEVTLDFFPAEVPRRVHEERLQHGRDALAFLGLQAEEQEQPGPLLLTGVVSGSRAERAGLKKDDVLVAVDGVQVHSLADIVPSGRSRQAELVLRRGKLETSLVRRIDVEGFSDVPAEDLLWASALVGFAIIVVVLFLMPGSRLLVWFERRVAARLQLVKRRPGKSAWAWMKIGVTEALQENIVPGASGEPLLARLVPYFLFLAVSALFTGLSLGQTLLGPELDLGLIFLATATALVTSGLMLGGVTGPGRWSIFAGLGQAALVLSFELPAALALISVILLSGSLRLEDIVSAQGGLPWEWNLFANPILFFQFMLFVAPALSESSRAAQELPEADVERPSQPACGRRSRYLMFFAEWTHVFVVSALATALFLGGWSLPGVSRLEQVLSPYLLAVGAGSFLVKSWLLSAALLWTRWVLPRARVDQLMGFCWKWLIPGAVLGLAASFGWIFGTSRAPLLQTLSGALRYALFGFVLFLCVYVVRRVGVSLKQKSPQLSVNPWL